MQMPDPDIQMFDKPNKKPAENLTKRQQAEKNRAQAVHMHIAGEFGWPNNRAQRRRHEARVRKVLENLPPMEGE